MDNTAQGNNPNDPIDDTKRVNISSSQDDTSLQSVSSGTGFAKEAEPMARAESADHEKTPDISPEIEHHVEISKDPEQASKLPEGLSKSPADMSIKDMPGVSTQQSSPAKNEYTQEQILAADKLKVDDSFRWKLVQFGRFLKRKALPK